MALTVCLLVWTAEIQEAIKGGEQVSSFSPYMLRTHQHCESGPGGAVQQAGGQHPGALRSSQGGEESLGQGRNQVKESPLPSNDNDTEQFNNPFGPGL